MPLLTVQEDGPRYISGLNFGAFAMVLAPFGLWLGLVFAVDGGVLFPSRADEAWAVFSRRSLADDQVALDDSTVISLDRSVCFGRCPDYSLRLYGSGKVEYLGKHYVCDFGERTAMVDPREVRRVVEAMLAAGYMNLSWADGALVMDTPTVTTSLHHNGRIKRTVHVHGDSGAPRWLWLMEQEIDRVAGTARWLPFFTDDGRGYCKSEDGQVRALTRISPLTGGHD